MIRKTLKTHKYNSEDSFKLDLVTNDENKSYLELYFQTRVMDSRTGQMKLHQCGTQYFAKDKSDEAEMDFQNRVKRTNTLFSYTLEEVLAVS